MYSLVLSLGNKSRQRSLQLYSPFSQSIVQSVVGFLMLCTWCTSVEAQSSTSLSLSFQEDEAGKVQVQTSGIHDLNFSFWHQDVNSRLQMYALQCDEDASMMGVGLRAVSLPDELYAVAYDGAARPIFSARVHADPHLTSRTHEYATLVMVPSQTVLLEWYWKGTELPQDLSVFYANPGASSLQITPAPTPDDDGCPAPAYKTRQDWCPDGSCPKDSTPSFTVPDHLVVHHSASGNVAADWDAVMRIIWDYHVNFRNWDDIGYNWIIAPNGHIYEGRGDDVLGAHFCSNNTGTVGICMLGTYDSVTPTDTALASLTALLSAKAEKYQILPDEDSYHASSGKVVPNIAGHRDGCSTECPGQMLYNALPLLRADVKDFTDIHCPITVSNAQVSAAHSLRLIPNPVHEVLSVVWEDDYRGDLILSVIDAHGTLVTRYPLKKLSPRLEIDVPAQLWTAGYYQLLLQTDRHILRQSFIKL